MIHFARIAIQLQSTHHFPVSISDTRQNTEKPCTIQQVVEPAYRPLGVVLMLNGDTLFSTAPYLLNNPSLVSAGGPAGPANILALLASVAITFVAWQAWTARPRADGENPSPATVPPNDLHPAYAGALASGRISDTQIEATVLEMVLRRALVIEPDREQKSKVQIRILDPDDTRDEFESELMALLQQRANNGVISFKVLTRLRNEWGVVRGTLRRKMVEYDWLKQSELQSRLPFLLPGSIGLLITMGMIIVAIVTSSGWPLLGGMLVGIVGSAVLIAGNIVPDTTPEGERAALPWRAYRSGLVISREKEHGAIDLDQAFPYIVAMGMAPGFDRYLRRSSQTGYIPRWIGSRAIVLDWPEGWHTYWIALHTALAPTDPTNTPPPPGSNWRRSLTGGRF